VVEFDAEPQLYLAYRVPSFHHPDFPALDVLTTVLGDGRTSRLRKRLILTEQAARYARTDLELGIDPGLLEVALQPLAGRSLTEVEAMAREEMARLARSPASPDELAAVRKRMRASLVYRFESNISFARWLAQNECMAGSWRAGYEYVDRIDAVTADDVMRVAAEYLTPRNEIRVELRRPEEGEP
jgi:predicted Zn-dependent peptidase